MSEIFGPTIQGEGALIGRPTVFVRTGGCDFRCRWCDTLYAVLPQHRGEWQPMEAAAILDEVLRLAGGQPILVTLSGGNPALQPLEPLLDAGRARGLSFALETQGSVVKPWFARLDHLTLSPKPPSSAMKTDWKTLAACVEAAGPSTRTSLKIVVFDEADYRYAREVNARFPGVAMYLQAGTDVPPGANAASVPSTQTPAPASAAVNIAAADVAERVSWLLERVTRDGWNDATVLPQLHVLLWGSRRGV